MQIKFNYTYGGEYKLNDGSDYVGYFNVDDQKNVYSGRYYDSSSTLLYNTNEISGDYYKSNSFKDRFYNDVLYLPYDLNHILIEPNEIVTAEVLNKKIDFLQENLIYVYSNLFMGDTDVPVDNNVNILCNKILTKTIEWVTKPKDNSLFGWSSVYVVPELSGYAEFDNIKRFAVVPFDDDTGVNIICISNTYVFSLTSTISQDGQLSGSSFVSYSKIIDYNSNEECENLEDITFDGKFLYISDSKINGGGQIFKYDVTSYRTNDKVFSGKKFLIEPIGGYGGTEKKDKFNGCSVLGSKPKELWVYDSGNNYIRVYDDNFVWKANIKLPSDGSYVVLDIRHRIMNNHTYVLFEDKKYPDNIKFGLFEYDEKRNYVSSYIFEDILYPQTDGRFNRMAISEQDSNVFYVSTDSSIFKKYFSKPQKTFAAFNRNKFYSSDLFIWDLVSETWSTISDYAIWNYAEFFISNFNVHDIYISLSKQNKDNLFFAGESYISHLNERTDYFNLLKNVNFNYFNNDNIKLKSNEYNQSLILNKQIYKLFSNIIQIKNNIKGRFIARFNEFGDLIYLDYIQFIDEEINTLNIELDYNSFVNDNELVQPNVINRIFNKIYNLQLALLKLTIPRILNNRTVVDFNDNTNIYQID
jgi:hypothetical protein